MVSISPKVWLPSLISIVASVLLWQLTGDKEWLILGIGGLVNAGVGTAAPPAPKVTMSADVTPLSRKRKRKTHRID
jgi:hypothetical protein